MKHLLISVFSVCSLCASAQELAVFERIRSEAYDRSHIDSLSYRLLDWTGPRLAGSDGAERGYGEAQRLMAHYGLANARIEFARPWHRGGWEIERAYAAMTAPYYIPVFPALVGWTGGTKGLERGEVVSIEAADSAEFAQKYSGKLGGKIVLMPSARRYAPNFGPAATRRTEQELDELKNAPAAGLAPRKRAEQPFNPLKLVRAERPLAVVGASGEFNNPGITFFDHQEGRDPIAPEFNVTMEVHGLMERLVRGGEKVEMELDVQTRFIKERPIRNVLAEIEGTDLKNEVVLIGAHLDSYHQSPGAGDDGAGCIVMLEAMRILKTLGLEPRRTVRVALWGGEEVGLHGSSGYVEQHADELKDIALYLNSDYGPGKFRGIFTQGNEAAASVFEGWLAPFAGAGCSTVSRRSVGSTDHVPFDERGVAAFQFIQDDLEWGRGSHRATDFSERLIKEDLQHNAAVVAWLVYCAANAEANIPRK